MYGSSPLCGLDWNTAGQEPGDWCDYHHRHYHYDNDDDIIIITFIAIPFWNIKEEWGTITGSLEPYPCYQDFIFVIIV